MKACDEFRNGGTFIRKAERAGKAEENEMNTEELQRILGYLNIGLAIAHDSGVSIGHFGSGDFIQLAQTVNGVLLRSIPPAKAAGQTAACGPDAAIAVFTVPGGAVAAPAI